MAEASFGNTTIPRPATQPAAAVPEPPNRVHFESAGAVRRRPSSAAAELTSDRADLQDEIERLLPKAETGNQWAHICALEARYVELTSKQLPAARPRRQPSELERAHFRCVAELMVLKPRRVIGNPDRFDVLNRADYLDAFLGVATAYAKAMVADISKEFPIGFIEDETDRLTEATSDVVGALKNAVDRMIEAEVA
jgi:hypothetical protein